MSDMRQFVATPTVEELEAEIERVETFNRANWAALQEAQRQIKRLRKQKQIAVDALFSICQSDWGIGHSLAKPAHKAIKELAALENKDE